MTQQSPARRLARTSTVAVLAAATLVFGAGSAAAHVTVNPSSAEPGAYTKLTFRVPNESATAGTVGIKITIPADTPLASVRYRQQPGWTAKAVTEKLPTPVQQGDVKITEAVTSVTFTAQDGVRIGPGEFAEFDLSVGPLPELEQLSFPTEQTYDDGTVVAWDDPVTGAEEPEHPAPTLSLTGEPAGEHNHSSGAASSEAAPSGAAPSSSAAAAPSVGASAAPTSADDQGTHTADAAADTAAVAAANSDSAARTLAVIGILIGAVGLLVGALGLRRRSGRKGA